MLSAGVDHLLSSPIVKETRIPITNSSGIHGPPIAEWTVMNWLVASRKYIMMYEAQQRHEWSPIYHGKALSSIHDQVGARVGILGYGSIGRQSMLASLFFHPNCFLSFADNKSRSCRFCLRGNCLCLHSFSADDASLAARYRLHCPRDRRSGRHNPGILAPWYRKGGPTFISVHRP